jgi:hypothetical protein
MPTTLTKHRIIHALGYVEFPEGQLAEAEAYRDVNHSGCEIVVVSEDVPDSV